MIHKPTLWLLWLVPVWAWGQAPEAGDAEEAPSAEMASDATETSTATPEQTPSRPPVDHTPDTALESHRSAFDALTERAIGQTSRAVRFDWRRSPIQVGINAGLPAELNNYNSIRTGALVRFPTDDLLLSLGLSWVWVRRSRSTELLALTPYRQPGRPSRLELDFDMAYPIAEGVSTSFLGFMPSTELVLSGVLRVRYYIYPGAWSGLSLQQSLQAIVDPTLSDKEVGNLEDDRLPGMEIDRARYGAQAGVSNDLYFQSGFFFSSQLMLTLPLLDFLTETKLGWGYEIDLLLGFAF
ncbi:MAG: hypothetical protein ACE366_03850 [Bradymonadia bacterium]